MMTGCLESVAIGSLLGALGVLALAATLYTVILAVLEARYQFVADYTWLTVVIGVLLTLSAVALVSWQAATLALAAFVVSGTPILIWSWARDVLNRQALRDELSGWNDD